LRVINSQVTLALYLRELGEWSKIFTISQIHFRVKAYKSNTKQNLTLF